MRKSAPLFCALLLSLSARRAWIEIQCWRDDRARPIVALRKESVDRNKIDLKRLPAGGVALRKESVDRNAAVSTLLELTSCRSPQGERG